MAQGLIPFQFDNLVKGRIPFGFLNLGVNIAEAYNHVHKLHLDNLVLPLAAPQDPEAVLQLLRTQGFPMDFALVVVCDRGSDSEKMAGVLESAGYKNVFYLKGGWTSFLQEQKSGF